MSTSSYTIFGREYTRQYDAIVIGAGIAGLFCANILAKGGMKVLLLERHFMLGGFCSTFRRKSESRPNGHAWIRWISFICLGCRRFRYPRNWALTSGG
jgi:glycine/D-amino acid oxidase-like deaminating enzyme